MVSLNAFSADFYQCDGFAGVDEYRVGINLQTGKSGFFDNDSMSYMKLVKRMSLEISPAQNVAIFQGKDERSTGDLQLYFNETAQNATLTILYADLTTELIGEASCQEIEESWDDLK